MATISAFSPQRFFRIANGHPVEPDEVQDSSFISLPTHGAVTVPASTPPHNRSLWINGIVARSEERARFVQQIREGAIPTPLTPYSSTEAIPGARLISPSSIHAENRSVVSTLGLLDTLLDLAERSTRARCPHCSTTLAAFPSPHALALEIAARWEGRRVSLSLIGAADAIRPWASELGYSPQEIRPGQFSARIDTFTCSTSTSLALQDVLRSTLRIPLTWFAISDEQSTTQLSWYGRCEKCDYVESRPNVTRLRELLEKGLTKEDEPGLSREIHGRPLRELLQLPLRTLVSDEGLRTLFSATQQHGITSLNLGEITLSHRASHLSPQAIVSIALLGSEVSDDAPPSVTIIDAPLSLLSHEQQGAHYSLTTSLATHSPYVWLSDAAAPLPTATTATGHQGKLLGTLSFQETGVDQVEVRANQSLLVSSSKATRHKPLALDLFRALEGSPSPLVSFLGENLFSEVFIPYFPHSDIRSKMVIHELGAMEQLAKLFAASHHAKTQGLPPKIFTIGQVKRESTICPSCDGTGLSYEERRSRVCDPRPCFHCWGTRLRSPAKEVTFKGKALWEILNAPLSSSVQLLRSLPKMGDASLLIELLDLGEIPLGMPVALLSPAARRLIAIARGVLEGTLKRPSLMVVEEPFAGLSSRQIDGLLKVVRHPQFTDKNAWIFTSHAPTLEGLEDLRYLL